MPVKIALIGAPSSGKTELANELERALERNVGVVDGYADKLQADTDLALSHFASYVGNAMVATHRLIADQIERQKEPDLLILCGTTVETTVYTALHALASARANINSDRHAQITMMFLSMFHHDTWDFDLAYYLPLPEDRDEWDRAVDENIPEAADALGISYTTLPQDRDERVGKVLEDILKHEATTTDGSGVRGSGEIGSGDTDSVGAVSDVQE